MRAALTLVALVAAASTAHATPAQELADGRTKFSNREFSVAYPILNALVFPRPRLAQPDELVETYVMVGACLVELGRTDDAKEMFAKALDLQPDRGVIEGPLFSRSVVRTFEDTRTQIVERNKQLEDARKLQQQIDAIEKLSETMVVFEEHSYLRNFVPFGAGQFQNNMNGRGIAFAAAEGVTLAASVFSWGYLVNKYGLSNDHVPLAEATTVQRLQFVELATGIAFIALYGIGVVDSLYHYQSRVKKDWDESLLTPEQRRLLEKTKKKPAKTSFHLSPFIAPDAHGAIGLGLSWEN